ncbi:NAD(P)-dependent oxidoreductase [Arthrobacter sp. NPDC056691]|uniref:NAD(P)-dependent oxidoreductase n=1 Tax=Arthrobacter sp. NPDC056691 TaxID=3345913 RepID=UPI00366BD678
MSRVLIIGGSGRTGRLIADEAKRLGHDVTITARDPRRVTDEGTVPQGIGLVHADVHDPASVLAAVKNTDAVIVAVSSSARGSGSVYSDAARAVIGAVAPGTRVIVVSSGGVARDDKGLPLWWFRRILTPLFMNDLYTDMKVMEDMFRASELDWTIVRASYLKDGPGGGEIRISDGSNPRGGWKLSRHDLAAFVAAQLNTEEWSRRLPTLAQ